MSSLGTFLILTAFVLASGAFAASIAGARRQRQSLVEGGTGLFDRYAKQAARTEGAA